MIENLATFPPKVTLSGATPSSPPSSSSRLQTRIQTTRLSNSNSNSSNNLNVTSPATATANANATLNATTITNQASLGNLSNRSSSNSILLSPSSSMTSPTSGGGLSASSSRRHSASSSSTVLSDINQFSYMTFNQNALSREKLMQFFGEGEMPRKLARNNLPQPVKSLSKAQRFFGEENIHPSYTVADTDYHTSTSASSTLAPHHINHAISTEGLLYTPNQSFSSSSMTSPTPSLLNSTSACLSARPVQLHLPNLHVHPLRRHSDSTIDTLGLGMALSRGVGQEFINSPVVVVHSKEKLTQFFGPSLPIASGAGSHDKVARFLGTQTFSHEERVVDSLIDSYGD